MFAGLLPELRADVDVIKKCITGAEAIRALSQNPPPGHVAPPAVCPFEHSAHLFPSTLDWRIFDHCAAVTRLYAVYEQFAIEVLNAWLADLPSIFPRYQDLPSAVQKEHCAGVARILPRAGEGRYKHLNIQKVIEGLNDGVTGKTPYALPIEAFVVQDQNLRGDILGMMFNRAGVPDTWGWIKKHSQIADFEINVLGGSETAESQLKTFISYRNDAAHGDVSNVLDAKSLNQLADFVSLLCEVLAERLDAHQTTEQVLKGMSFVLGAVTEEYRNNIVVVETNGESFQIGEHLIVASDNYCFQATVVDLQVNGVSVMRAEHVSEVGIKFDKRVKKNATIVR